MTGFRCQWCKTHVARSIAALRAHADNCAVLKKRIMALPSDLAHKVHAGGLKLEAAETEAEARPPIKL